MPLTNSQYNALMRVYEEKRAKSQDIANLHYERACQKVPELASIDASISSASLDQAKKLLAGDDTALASLKEEIRSLSDRRRRLLSDAGFPEDYLEQHFECPDCQDTGYVGTKKCHCFLKAIIDLFYTQSNLKGLLEQENFEHFNFDYYSSNYRDRLSGQNSRELATRAYQECMNFIHNFDTEHGNLLLFGNTGIGKTFLSHCIAKEVMDSLHSVLYLTASEFFDALLEKALNRNDESCLLYEQIHLCDLLIIDDLGTELTNSFVSSQLFLCINERIMRKKSTIISTNLKLEDFSATYSERTFSRIASNYQMTKLVGKDIRIQKIFLGGK